MRKSLLVALAIVLSVVVVFGAYSLILKASQPAAEADITVGIAYAFIGQAKPSENITSLNYNLSKTRPDAMLASYVIVLRVTNNANVPSMVTSLRADAAPQITTYDAFFTQPNGSPVPGPMGLPAVSVSNALIMEHRNVETTGGWSNIWQPHSARLVAITGVTTLEKFEQQYLQNCTLDMYASASAQPAYSEGKSDYAYDYKHITFNYIDGDYLYNALGKNQTLIIDGLDADVITDQ